MALYGCCPIASELFITLNFYRMPWSLNMECSIVVFYIPHLITQIGLYICYWFTGTLGLKGKPSNDPDVGKAYHTATRYYEFSSYSNRDSQAFSDFVSEDCSKRLSTCRNVDDYADSMFSIFQDSMDKFAPPSIRKSSVNKKNSINMMLKSPRWK